MVENKDPNFLMEWDTYNIAQAQLEFIKENPDEYPQYNGMDDDDILSTIYADTDFFEMEWESLTEWLTEIMQKKNYRNYYKHSWDVKVENFGWRSSNGEAKIKAKDGTELLQKILPDTDCTFRIFHDGRTGIKIQNFHHDSPTGNEWYHVRPMTIKEVEEHEGWI